MASKAKLVTRTATSSSVTSDNIAKDAALTHAELDSNLINLRDQSIGIVADDSATIDIKAGDSLYIQGGTNVTTSTNSDGTITINATASGDVTGSSTTTFTNKTIDANGTGNNISNIDIANMTAASVVLEGEGIGSNDNDTTLPTSAAVKDYADTKAVLTGSTNNQLVTVTGAHAISGESNLTFDGSTLGVTGNITATTSIANDGIIIDDNAIKASRSNDNILIAGNGTGRVDIHTDLAEATLYENWNGNPNRITIAGLAKENLSVDADTVGRQYGVGVHLGNKLSNGSSSNSNFRPRAMVVQSTVDLDGNDYTKSGISRGPTGITAVATAQNSSSSSAGILQNSRGGSMGAVLANYNSPAQNITQRTAYGFEGYIGIEGDGSGTSTMDVGYGIYSSAYTDKSGGAATITDFYAFYTPGDGATNNYAFYSASDTAESRLGTIERYRETQHALTSSATISVDASLAPVHKVTLAHNTQFTISNLGTGQTITLIITQDGTGSRTATFSEADSTAVKFAGGYTALTTAANAIDVVTIYNDGTQFLGNCAKAYA